MVSFKEGLMKWRPDFKVNTFKDLTPSWVDVLLQRILSGLYPSILIPQCFPHPTHTEEVIHSALLWFVLQSHRKGMSLYPDREHRSSFTKLNPPCFIQSRFEGFCSGYITRA
ncbi:hypothetical protein TNCT_1331 [Trichonephila clavata]|uniref:Uncharacterized protein n=1 Tax=Trichonephila clavata TaxID=2740835 RepID=A0A8X6LWX1_TRICU|nr:hypothetical protein TNCT_1331 [Trichonephila clavata]